MYLIRQESENYLDCFVGLDLYELLKGTILAFLHGFSWNNTLPLRTFCGFTFSNVFHPVNLTKIRKD